MATGSGPTNCIHFNTLKKYLQEIIDSTQIPLYITEYDIATLDDEIQKECYSEQIPLFMEEERIAGIPFGAISMARHGHFATQRI